MGARVLSGAWAGQSSIVVDASGAFVIPSVGVVAGKQAITIPCSCGSFALTGEPVALVQGHNLAAGCGSFALSGEPAALAQGHKLAAGCGSVALTGEPAALSSSVPLTRHIVAQFAGGSLTLTGFGSLGSLTESSTGFGEFTLTGETMWRHLSADFGGGAISVGGRTSFRGLGLSGQGGVLALTGESIEVSLGRRLFAVDGACALTGFEEVGAHGRQLAITVGVFSLFGVGSGNKVQRLGGAPGVGVMQWKVAGKTIADWVS